MNHAEDQLQMKDYTVIIGIDPGTHTGYAVWSVCHKQFFTLETGNIHEYLYRIRNLHNDDYKIFVRIEDARLRKWYGDDKGDRAKSQGVGSIKRDCAIWYDFCKDLGIDYEMVAPKAIKTKLTAKSFKNMTGWEGRTNEHSRDAGMLCWQYEPKRQRQSTTN